MSVRHGWNNVIPIVIFTTPARVQPSIENPVEYEINNTIGTLNVLKCSD